MSLAGENPATSRFVVSTTDGDPFIAGNVRSSQAPFYALLTPFIGLVFLGFGLRRSKNNRILLVIMLACCGIGLHGCASARNFQNLGTPPGPYHVTVTGTSGSLMQSVTVTLTVQP
jgi:hypothetical protein